MERIETPLGRLGGSDNGQLIPLEDCNINSHNVVKINSGKCDTANMSGSAPLEIDSSTEEYDDEEKSNVIGEYFIKKGYLCTDRIIRVGKEYVTQTVPLCNFDIRITKRIMQDDGSINLPMLALSGILLPNTKLKEIEIPAANFPTPQKWIYSFNKNVIVEPGMKTKDLVRHAIEVRSTDAQEITVFAHTGWRIIDGEMHYLSGNGSLFGNNIYVKLSQENERYQLPSNNNIDEIEAIKTSLSFMDVAKSDLSIPLWIFTYLATLTSELSISPNFSTYVFGETGQFKTAFTILALAHFGDFKDAKQLPSFRDTINSCERRAFTLKDTLMVVDDYHPASNAIESSKMEQLAQFLVRGFGNRTGRARLNSDSSDKGRFSPRGMLIITGEELVALQSSLARIMLLIVEDGTVNQNRLTELQKKADHLPYAMASFLRWTRTNLPEIKKKFDDTFSSIRNRFQNGSHKRLSEQIAFMIFMADILTVWLMDRGIFDSKMAKKFIENAEEIFLANADKLDKRLSQDDPAEQFIEMLRMVIIQGRARIEDIKDKTKSVGSSTNTIGYYDEVNFYMLTTAVFHEIRLYCAQERQHFPFHKNTTLELLKSRRLITGYNIQKNIRGKNMKCMIVPISILRRENIKDEE